MVIRNLIIFKYRFLYEIIKELEENFNFIIFEENDEKNLNKKLKEVQDSLIITKKKLDNIENQLILDQVPIKLSYIIEKINIELHKLHFNEKSQIVVGKYMLDLNSRELVAEDRVLKLTEKETNMIFYLSKSKNGAGIDQLQSCVWGYHSKLETHTVETHIYRLRKKILETFNDERFIVNNKNGYQIK
jgi:DNA-binding response OmpR family regulator